MFFLSLPRSHIDAVRLYGDLLTVIIVSRLAGTADGEGEPVKELEERGRIDAPSLIFRLLVVTVISRPRRSLAIGPGHDVLFFINAVPFLKEINDYRISCYSRDYYR
jgi:hypothetical protein